MRTQRKPVRPPVEVGAEEGVIRVNGGLSFEKVIRASGLAVYNDNVANPAYFPFPGLGIYGFKPDLVKIRGDIPVPQALAESKREVSPFGGLWDLVAYAVAHWDFEGKIIAFGSSAVINKVLHYPYIGVSGKERFIALKRSDIAMGSDYRALLGEQVELRA